MVKRTIRGVRDKIPGGYVLGRTGKGKGAVTLIPFTQDKRTGGVGGGGGSGGASIIAIEFYAGGLMRANEVIGQIIVPVEMTLQVGLPDSYAQAVIAASGAALVLTIRKALAGAAGLGTAIGTITFTASATGVISFLTETPFAVGDRLLIQCASPANPALSSTTVLIQGSI